MHYEMTYWLETMIKCFQSRIDAIESDRGVSIELCAVDVDVYDLIHAPKVAKAYSTYV